MLDENCGDAWHKNDSSKDTKNILLCTHGSFITEFINAMMEEFGN